MKKLQIDVTSLAEVWIEIKDGSYIDFFKIVTSLAEVWIEIVIIDTERNCFWVTSLAEVWIEIATASGFLINQIASLPLRKCGLKSPAYRTDQCSYIVTSLAEVWIEIP